MKVIKSRKVFDEYLWRGEVSRCPYCHKEPKCEHPSLEWDNPAWTVYAYLSLDMPNWRSDSFAVFSMCPTCKKISWLHYKLDSDYNEYERGNKWPEPVKKAIFAEHRRRLHRAISKWRSSPCNGCENLRTLSLQHLYFAVGCDAGKSGPCEESGPCAYFSPEKSNRKTGQGEGA